MPTGSPEPRGKRIRGWAINNYLQIFMRRFAAWPILGLLLLPASAQQTVQELAVKELGEKSLEDLMNIEVTSVSKRSQPMSKVASAIFVITHEDIRNSGATNVPDLLRMVPGLDVAQINAHNWAISARGLNEELANKLLVLIDGRTVYSPLFAGVYWDVQDLPLEDLERIEVIRGPGATVWGANAVNGVINIITKPAKETQGALAAVGGGTHERAFGMAQYGGQIHDLVNYRIFAKGLDQGPFSSISGLRGHDESDFLHSGFRADASLSKKNCFTVEGDLYKSSEGEINDLASLTTPYTSLFKSWSRLSGGNLLGRWTHNFSVHSDTELQIYLDEDKRSTLIEDETVKSIDLDFQHHFHKGSRQDLVWGAGYRHFSYMTLGTFFASFHPATAGHDLFSSFLQDEIAVRPDSVYLTLGAKFEHNDFSGLEFQPSIRLAWSVTKNQTLWAAYSRARRTPAPVDRGLESNFRVFPSPAGMPTVLTAEGSPTTVSENLDAFEAGYRSRILTNLSLDFAAFYNKYSNLQTMEPGAPFLDPDPAPLHVEVPFNFANQMRGETHGFEAAGNWKATSRWTISPGYTFEQIHLHLSATSQDPGSVRAGEGNSPRHQAQVRSNLVLRKGLEWNASLYFVDRLKAQMVPAYTRLDTGLAWRVSRHLTIDLVGQNLLKISTWNPIVPRKAILRAGSSAAFTANSFGSSDQDRNQLNPKTARRANRLPALQRMGYARNRRSIYRAILAFLIFMNAVPVLGQDHTLVEYQVEAAFLYNFAKFIQWPADAFQTEKSPIVICIFGHDPFDNILDHVVRGKTVNGRELVVRRENETPGLRGCQLVFVDERESKRLPLVLGSLAGSSALVVGESEAFAQRGGAVQFFIDENKLHFAINVDAIQRARLTVSSRLLALARIVHDYEHPKG